MIHISTPFSLRPQFLVEKTTRLLQLKTIPEAIINRLIGVLLLMISVAGKAQTVLNTGDIAIVGVNSTNPDKFSFVILKNITTNTVVNFTDNGFTAGATARTGEGFLTFTAQTNYSAGTVFTWINGSAVVSDWNSNNPSSFSFNASGDQLFAFTGATSNWATQSGITLLFGINYGTALSSTSSASNTVQPIALTSNYFLNLPSSSASNNYFATGSGSVSSVTISGPAPGLLTSFVDATKWFTQSNSTGATTFPTFFITVQWPVDAYASSTGGSVSPGGTTFVNNGASQTYTITPDPGFIISDVFADGSLIGAVNNYTFNNVITSHTISANFICTALEISDQPLLTQTVCQNSSSSGLTVAASGDGLNYQWYADDDNSGFDGSSINGATNSTFIPPTEISGTFFYYCIISGECGTAKSNYSTVTVSQLLTWYQDADGDGFGNPENSTQTCTAPGGYASDNTDCNDADNTVYPGAPEICDDKDNDCNGTIDEGVKTTFYRDADGDDFGDATNFTQACTAPSGYVSNSADCDDADNTVYPGAPEICDGKDNDCNGTIDEGVKTTFYRDADGDGFGDATNSTQACTAPSGYVSNGADCDDADNTVYPGAPEICDDKDNDCNGTIDEGVKTTFYRDADGDDFGDATNFTQACTAPSGYVSNSADCDDADNTVYPGAPEICDGKGNDCTGTIDEGVKTTFYRDGDGDGFGDATNSTQACTAPSGYISNSADCDDADNTVYPGAPEICDGKDNDCNGTIDEGIKTTFYRDADGDGFGDATNSTQACTTPSGYVSNGADCDDADNTVYPGAPEICDGKDNDCNGTIDEGVKTTFYRDADGDDFGDPAHSIQACIAPSGYVSNNTDCKDDDPSMYPGAPEICDGKDNDCNGSIDDNTEIITFYRDADNDGYGNASGPTVQSCSAPAGYVSNNGDCNDADGAIHPGATEICDGKDNNCDGQTDEGFDDDGDGYTVCNGDCDDHDATVYPGAPELCDEKDNNCNGQIDEEVKTTFYRDADGDGYGNPAISTQACTKPAGYVTDNTDCDDTWNTVYPGAPELCDGLDNNCNGQADENSGITYYKDEDDDGYGNPAINVTTCRKPAGYVTNNTDCNDGNKNIYPDAPEICDGIDNDCDGLTDEGVTRTYYRDADGDGYGNSAISIKACSKPSGYVTNNTDCNDNSLSIHPGATEVCVNGIDENCNGQTDEGCITAVKICAYSQSAYNNNGISCVPNGVSSSGQIMLNAVDTQPGDSAIFGLSTTGRFFTLRKSDIQNGYIYKLLPGNGTSKALKGYATYTKSSTWSNVPLSSTGKIQNELLAQTMTLFFNMQLSPQIGTLPINVNLSIRRLTLCTLQGSLIQAKFTSTVAVANCLQTKYGSQGITVGNLYRLSNELLGNINTCNLNYTDVNNAIKSINELFNGCVLLNISSSNNNNNNNNNAQTDIVATPEKDRQEINSMDGLQVTTAPNPFRENVRFNVISPESGKLRILIYDVNGIKQGELEQEIIKNMPATLWFKNKQLRQGVLFYRISINKQVSTGKIIQIK